MDRIKSAFDVDDVGPLEDYIGCKLDFDWSAQYCRLTQPVLVQSMSDLHGAGTAKAVNLPATPGTTLQKAQHGDPDVIDKVEQRNYRGLVAAHGILVSARD